MDFGKVLKFSESLTEHIYPWEWNTQSLVKFGLHISTGHVNRHNINTKIVNLTNFLKIQYTLPVIVIHLYLQNLGFTFPSVVNTTNKQQLSVFHICLRVWNFYYLISYRIRYQRKKGHKGEHDLFLYGY